MLGARLPLTWALRLDAAVTGLMGLALSVGNGFLGNLLGLPPNLLLGAGLSLLPFALFVVYVAARRPVSLGAARFVIGYNVLWVLLSLLLVLVGGLEPTTFGAAFVVVQALVVVVFASLQYRGLRRSSRAAAATHSPEH